MKKNLFFVCMAVVMAGCKKNGTITDSGKDTLPGTLGNKTIAGCKTSLIIAKSSFADAAEYTEWRNYNDTIVEICQIDANGNYEVDITKITDPEDKADWLAINDKNIDILKSENFIMASHTLPTGLNIAVHNTKGIRIDTLRNVINPYIYKYGRYDYYVSFDLTSSVTAQRIRKYDDSKICYSIPFLRILTSSLKPDDELEFCNATVSLGEDSAEVTIIRIKSKPNNNFFNYSHWPTLYVNLL